MSGVEKLQNLLNNSLKKVPVQTVSNVTYGSNSLISSKIVSLHEENEMKRFFEQIKNFLKGVMRYEDKSLQNKARSLVPLETIQIAAIEKLREIQK